MPEGLHRIVPGGPTPATAHQWNQLIDAQSTVTNERTITGFPSLPPDYWANAVQIKNTAGYDLLAGEILVCDEPLTDPAKSEDIFRKRPVLTGIANDWSADHWGRSAILAQPLKDTEIGWAYQTGLTRALLSRLHDQHDHADIGDGDETNLVSHPSGSWQILWTNAVSGSAPDWAVVQHRGMWGRELKCQIPTGTELVPGTSMAVPVSWDSGDALDPGNTFMITVHHNWFDQQGNPLGSESKLLAKWFTDERKWVVVAAEC